MRSEASTVFLLVLLGLVAAQPAPDITKMQITSCTCTECRVTQMGYGSVRITFQGSESKASCTSTAITDWSNIIVGWQYVCDINGSNGGRFLVQELGGSYCGINYDHVDIHVGSNGCSGTPCSSFG